MAFWKKIFDKQNKTAIRATPITDYRTLSYSPVVRECEILTDCIEIVNHSSNVETVIKRYDLLISTLIKLMRFSPKELQQAGISFPEPLSQKYEIITKNKELIFNQAIHRAYEKVVLDAQGLKTENARKNRIFKFFEYVEQLPELTHENIIYLKNLKINYRTINDSCLEIEDFNVDDTSLNDFYALSKTIGSAKDIKIKAKSM